MHARAGPWRADGDDNPRCPLSDSRKSEWELSNIIGLKGLYFWPYWKLSTNPHLLPQHPPPKIFGKPSLNFHSVSGFILGLHGWSNTGTRHGLVRTRGGLPSHQAGLLWLWLLAAAPILRGTPVGGVEKMLDAYYISWSMFKKTYYHILFLS